MVGVSGLPYFFVRRLRDGRWCVAHRVPGADVDRIDVECLTLKAAQGLAEDMNFQRFAAFWKAAYDGQPVEVEA